jgi:transketolase
MSTTTASQAAAEDLGDDRLDRGEGQRTKPAPFGHALVELARRPEIVGMTADLGKYTDLHLFAKAYPERYYQMGMAEQLLMGAAAGFAHEGACPSHDLCGLRLAPRLRLHSSDDRRGQPRRQDRLRAAGPDHGLRSEPPGDRGLALFRAMPNMTVIDPCDALEIEQIVPAIAAHKGPVYMRLLRGNVPLRARRIRLQFELGKAKLLRDGADVLVISSGIMTMRALEVAKALEPTGSPSACCMCRRSSRSTRRRSCAKPAQAGRLVVVAENHTVIGGLGEAVAGVLMREGVQSAVPPDRPTRRVPRCVARCRRCTTATASRPRRLSHAQRGTFRCRNRFSWTAR